MQKKILISLYFLVAFWVQPLSAELVRVEDVAPIMEKFFGMHVEEHELTLGLVQRSMKVYFEHFDGDKSYLLEEEVLSFLEMGPERLQEVFARVKRGDYRDFRAMHAVIQKAVVRAQKIRGELAEEMARGRVSATDLPPRSVARYPVDLGELKERQRGRMARFFLYHQGRTSLETMERRLKVFSLLEKKLARYEARYLFLDKEGKPHGKDKAEHLFATSLLKAFAKSLDTHSAYFSPEEAQEMRLHLEKHFEGIGVILSEGIDGVMIADLVPGSPAERSGKIQVNDYLVEIEGRSVTDRTFEEILEMLQERERGDFVLKFKRVNPETKEESHFQVFLKKQAISMQEERIQVSYEKYGSGIIGKIALYSFYESQDGHTSERDIKAAIQELRQKGDLVGLVLDLRENAGGFLSQAVKVAGLFVSNGVIVMSKYGKGQMHYLRNLVGKSYYNGPLVLLTSKMSASASEIVAQALQDYGVALIVGDERTFGKGSIQYQTVTDSRANVFFKVTIGRYYTVSGRSTQIEGVLADIVVPTQYAPYNIGERFLEYPLPADQVEPAYVDKLSDLDDKTRALFQLRYLPYLQRKVPFWKKHLSVLKRNSAERLARNPDFQLFLQRQEKIRLRQTAHAVNTIDEPIQIGMEDLQMGEGVNVVKDMILIEAQTRRKAELLLEEAG